MGNRIIQNVYRIIPNVYRSIQKLGWTILGLAVNALIYRTFSFLLCNCFRMNQDQVDQELLDEREYQWQQQQLEITTRHAQQQHEEMARKGVQEDYNRRSQSKIEMILYEIPKFFGRGI